MVSAITSADRRNQNAPTIPGSRRTSSPNAFLTRTSVTLPDSSARHHPYWAGLRLACGWLRKVQTTQSTAGSSVRSAQRRSSYTIAVSHGAIRTGASEGDALASQSAGAGLSLGEPVHHDRLDRPSVGAKSSHEIRMAQVVLSDDGHPSGGGGQGVELRVEPSECRRLSPTALAPHNLRH